MIAGHYATALIPYGRGVRGPLWLFLLCSNIADFLWLGLVFTGNEVPHPSSFLDATFQNIEVDMPYSHSVVPTLFLAVVVGILVFSIYRHAATAIWCTFLIVLHFLSDLLVGFQHTFLSIPLGLDLYARAPHLALIVEAIFGAVCVFLYARFSSQRGDPIAQRSKLTLYGVFIIGALIWLPTATIPLRKLFGM